MINLLPSHDETLVLPWSAEEVFKRFSRVTRNDLAAVADPSILFSGWVREDRFSISLKVSRPNNYLVRVKGKIESTSAGCLLFLDYQLFPTTKLFVTFWLLLTCLIAVVIGFQYTSMWSFLGVLAIDFFIFWITWVNFKLQLKMVREVVLKTVESTSV